MMNSSYLKLMKRIIAKLLKRDKLVVRNTDKEEVRIWKD